MTHVWTQSWTLWFFKQAYNQNMSEEAVFTASSVATWGIDLFCCCSLCSLNLFNEPSGAGFIRTTFSDSCVSSQPHELSLTALSIYDLFYFPSSPASFHLLLKVWGSNQVLKAHIVFNNLVDWCFGCFFFLPLFPFPSPLSNLPVPPWSCPSFLSSFPFFGCF